MQDGKLNTELFVAVFKASRPEGSKEKEEKYRKDIQECNKESEYRHVSVLLHTYLPKLQK